MSCVHGTTACPPDSSTAPASHDAGIAFGSDEVQIRKADGVRGHLGLYEVSVNGRVQYMTEEQIASTNFQRCADAAAHVAGNTPLGTTGPMVAGMPVAIARSPAEPVGKSVVVPGSPDMMTSGSTMEMAGRTGHDIAVLSKGSLTGVTEATLLAHSNDVANPTHVNIDGKALTPKQLAQELVNAGWRGGTLRLGVCGTGCNSYGQQLANELKALNAESVIQAPLGAVKVLGNEHGGHGLPQVITKAQGGQGWKVEKPGQGWATITAEQTPLLRVAESPILLRAAAGMSLALNGINLIQAVKLGSDFHKALEFKKTLTSGQFFKDFWAEVGSLPEGARIKIDGKVGTLDKSNGGLAIHFEIPASTVRLGPAASILSDGSRITISGRQGTIDKSNGVVVRFPAEEFTIRMTSDPKYGPGIELSGTYDGKTSEAIIDRTGVRELGPMM